jgi:NADH-quinone oxidoreductase subunit N
LITYALSSAGVPPLVGFFSKYYLFSSLQHVGLFGLVVVGLFASLISAFYYLRLIKILYFETAPKNFRRSYSVLNKLSVGAVYTLTFVLWAAFLFIKF